MTHSRLDFAIDEAIRVVMDAKPHFTKRQAYTFLREAVVNAGAQQDMPDLAGKQIRTVEITADNHARLTFDDGTVLNIEAETIYLPSAGTMVKLDLKLSN